MNKIMWIPISQELPPTNTIVNTKIIDADGKESNEQKLIRGGRLWWFPDMSMYVYYTPTHWFKL